MRYRAKSVEVQAVQYKPGEEISFNLVRQDPVIIRYSADETLYYCSGCGRSENWFGVERITEEPKSKDQLSGYVRINHPKDGIYWRKVLPFAFWSVKSGKEEKCEAPHANDFALDYAAGHNWDMIEGHRRAYDSSNNEWRTLFPGDWVVVTEKDGQYIYKDEKFKELYEKIEE